MSCAVRDVLRSRPGLVGVAQREDVAVGPDARIAEQVPRAADSRAPLQDRVRQLRVLLVNAVRGPDARDSRTDDQHVGVFGLFGTHREPPLVRLGTTIGLSRRARRRSMPTHEIARVRCRRLRDVTIPASCRRRGGGCGFRRADGGAGSGRHGHDVVVLEGRDRVGGRSYTTTIAGAPIDLGGTFVGPTQDAILALAQELGCQTEPTHTRGKNLIRWRGKVRSYRSTIPKLSIIELVDVSRIQWRFDRVSRRVPVDATVDVVDRRRSWTPRPSTSGCGMCTPARRHEI